MRGARARRGGDVLFGSAGWLFADLMLAVVVMLFLGAALSAQEAPESEPAAKTSTTTTTTTTPPVTTTTPPPPALLPQPVKVELFVDTEALRRGDAGVINAMRGEVAAALAGPLGGHRVGVVLTFGRGSIQRATDVAARFNDLVLRALGDQFASAAYRNYFTGGGDLSQISLEMFVFAP